MQNFLIANSLYQSSTRILPVLEPELSAYGTRWLVTNRIKTKGYKISSSQKCFDHFCGKFSINKKVFETYS